MVIAFCSHGLMVMTADFESASLGSIPSGSFLKRGGAEEACLAHNQKVGGSKPPSAIKGKYCALLVQLDDVCDF